MNRYTVRKITAYVFVPVMIASTCGTKVSFR